MKETTEIAVLDPKEYGLEQTQVSTIESAFTPKIIERNALAEQYTELMKSEITPEICKQMCDLRRKLVKVRTGIADIHKTQKAFYLAAGRFVDAWKNKETEPITQMEEKLREGEEYYERIEAQRIADLAASRQTELSAYTDTFPGALGIMSDEEFQTYLLGAKAVYDARIKAEKEAEEELAYQAELARQAQIKKERDDTRFRAFAGTGMVFTNGKFGCAKGGFELEELCELDDKMFGVALADATKMVAECKAEEIAEKERLAAIAAEKQKELDLAAAEKAKQDAIIAKQKAEIEAELKRQAELKAAEEKRLTDEKAEADKLANQAMDRGA